MHLAFQNMAKIRNRKSDPGRNRFGRGFFAILTPQRPFARCKIQYLGRKKFKFWIRYLIKSHNRSLKYDSIIKNNRIYLKNEAENKSKIRLNGKLLTSAHFKVTKTFNSVSLDQNILIYCTL